ncbi:hypothetical protein [Rhodopseudomonas palustris]|uniref:Uncharacterized protein n=1 Tax=Rhodopseudomonas palustris (strain BisB18) TaxID=316056 RepID=Q212N7_RHOPB
MALLNKEEEVREVYRQLESDLATLFKLVFSFRKPVTEGDIRIASVILRKWLTDGLLGKLCNAAGVKATVQVLDNSIPLAALAEHPAINYFLTAGVRFNGVPICGIYNSGDPFAGGPQIPVDQMHEREMRISEFLAQKRLYFDGSLFSCADIIKFTANKLGGAHFDMQRTPNYEKIDQASNYMKYGGPLPSAEWDPGSEIYMVLEPTSNEVLSGLHIEIVAAATTFIQIKFDGIPIMKLATKVSLRTRARRLLGLDRARFRFFQNSKPD